MDWADRQRPAGRMPGRSALGPGPRRTPPGFRALGAKPLSAATYSTLPGLPRSACRRGPGPLKPFPWWQGRPSRLRPLLHCRYVCPAEALECQTLWLQ